MTRIFTFILLAIFLHACGDEGVPPTANAGQDQSVELGSVVTLDGSASYDRDEDDTLTYSWDITSAPENSAAILNSPSTAITTITPDLNGEYTFQLTVNDGKWDGNDTVNVTVLPSGVPLTGPVQVLVFHSIDIIHGWQVGESLDSADFIVNSEYPSLVDGWNVGDIDASVIEVDPVDAYHPERFKVVDWVITKI